MRDDEKRRNSRIYRIFLTFKHKIMNLTNLTIEEKLQIMGLMYYSQNNTETQKEQFKSEYPELKEKLEWIDEMLIQYETAFEDGANWIQGLDFNDFIFGVEYNRQLDLIEMANEA